ncbi:MAG TPA: hypothetical protein VHN11_16995 [Xanthobacteraceae bacterium]|nr:hypothetical protein [Xanthobacteraceae bacterium]
MIVGLVFAGSHFCLAQEAGSEPSPGILKRAAEPGLFGAIGQWIDHSIAGMASGINNARTSFGEFGGRAHNAASKAASAVAALPKTAVVSGRAVCALAPNGEPDCQAATDVLCRSKGFQTGRSLEFESAQKCPARVWISGRLPEANECTTESFVTRAICR